MKTMQNSLLGELTSVTASDSKEEPPATVWEKDVARRALDELFSLAHQYNSSQAYFELIDFVARFRFYSLFNAMLIHTQMPGSTYVAAPHLWIRDYGRRIKVGARPIVILQPKGPVMFVFDVIDTEEEEGAPPLPPEVESPFEVRKSYVGNELRVTIENAKRDGVRINERQEGSQSAGKIQGVNPGIHLSVVVILKQQMTSLRIPLRYEVTLNSSHSPEVKYATIVHELGHLYCGHLGTPNQKWWPDRRGLTHAIREFEAESASYLVCKQLGIATPSEGYLASFLREQKETPAISLECVLKSTGLVEQMGRINLKPRKEDE